MEEVWEQVDDLQVPLRVISDYSAKVRALYTFAAQCPLLLA